MFLKSTYAVSIHSMFVWKFRDIWFKKVYYNDAIDAEAFDSDKNNGY